jgi:Viral BACON domain/Putative binding domain, N-terminal
MGGDRWLRVAHHCFIGVIVIGAMAALTAQSVVDPRYAEFSPSPEHDTVTNGVPVVTNYTLSIFNVGSGTPLDTVDLGKPTPVAGVIRVDFLPLLHVSLAPNVIFEARVNAVGPGGAAPSAVSNTFAFAPACTPAISPTSQSVGASGGGGSVAVSLAAGCTWAATSNVGWIGLTGATSGNGNGTVAYSVAANTSVSQRTGTVTIAGQTFTVMQAGVACNYVISPTNNTVVAGGANGSVSVTAPTGCTWSSTSNATWITFSGTTSGNGNGSVNYSVASNSSSVSRTGTLTIAGQTFTVTQAGVGCTYAISPTSNPSVAADGATGTVSVTAPAGCSWSSTSNATWISFSGATSGTGNGSVGYSVAPNSSTSLRTGTLTIAGQTFTIGQAGVPCNYTISPLSNLSVAAGGTIGSVAVTAPAGCAWSSTSNAAWITLSGTTSGSGNGSVNYTVASNASSSSRTGTLTIAGQTFTVTQAGLPCSYSISPAGNGSVGAGGGTGSVAVTAAAGCTWSSTSNAAWISFTGTTSGSGNGSVGYSVAANSSTSPRTGTLTIAGQTFTVTQAGVGCSYSISPTSNPSVGAGGASGSVTVTAPSGCTWSSTSNAAWIAFSGTTSGSGNGSVGYSVGANTSTSPRTGTLTIAGQTFSVTQTGATCTYSISPTNNAVAASGASGSATVTAPAGCSWSSTSNASWITFSGATSGSGNGSIAYSVSANSASSSRTGTLTIAGQTFTVDQAGTSCTYSISPGNITLLWGDAASGSITVTAPTGCPWTSSSDVAWISLPATPSGSGNGSVAYAVAANDTTTGRSGTVTVAGRTFTVDQGGAVCGNYSVSPTSASVGGSSTTATVSVTAPTGCVWSAISNVGWISFASSQIANGNGGIIYVVDANTSTSPRSGTLTIAGRTFTVNQDGACSYSLSPTSQSVPVGGGGGTTTVTAGAGCNWTATSNASWITVTSGASGSGNGMVGFSAAANSGSQARSGQLTVGGVTFTVNQAASTCTYTVSPATQSIAFGGGTGSATVTTGTGCTWTAQSTVTWITATGSGTGSGSFNYSVQANSGGPRTGTVTVGTGVFNVSQSQMTVPPAPTGLRIKDR